VRPCSFNGVYQPSILETFPSGNILLLSYFYDRISPLLPASPIGSSSSNPSSLTLRISDIASMATDVCLGPTAWYERWGDNPAAIAELEDRPEHCLDLTFMHALLRLGYEFPENRVVSLGKRIDGTELGWALGAGIALVGGELECKI